MGDRRDPVAEGLEEDDLYDVATWEERTRLDRFAVHVDDGIRRSGRWVLIAVALVLFVAQLGLAGYAAIVRPTLGLLTLLSVVPALALAGYVWYGDPTRREPAGPLAATFLLGVVFASIAALVNSLLQVVFGLVPVVGTVLFYYLVVGPVEETVKLLAVRVHAFRGATFDAVVDGAVYGAVAGLGFATIENALYITREVFRVAEMAGGSPLDAAVRTATARTFAGPGHVLYSAIAGYYLGLAKFNPDDAGPIVVKGLLIAALLHGTFNTLVSVLPIGLGTGRAELQLFGFMVLFDGLVFYVLYRKLRRYRSHYRRAGGEETAESG